MEDEDDGDERVEEDGDEEEGDKPVSSYKIEKYFGKADKSPKFAFIRSKYRPRYDLLRNFKGSMECSKSNLNSPIFQSTKIKIQHKSDYIDDYQTKNKLSFGPTARGGLSYDFNSSIKRKLQGKGSSILLGTRINSKFQFNGKIQYILGKIMDKAIKVKAVAEVDVKNGNKILGAIMESTYKMAFPSVNTYIPFISQHSTTVKANVAIKSLPNLRLSSFLSSLKSEIQIKSHSITTKSDKIYVEQRIKKDKDKGQYQLMLNVQDSRNILTSNGEFKVEKGSTEMRYNAELRFLCEYFKTFKYGICIKPIKPHNFQLLFEKNKINLPLINSLKLYLSNKSFLTKIINRTRIMGKSINYTLSCQLKRTANWIPQFVYGLDFTINM